MAHIERPAEAAGPKNDKKTQINDWLYASEKRGIGVGGSRESIIAENEDKLDRMAQMRVPMRPMFVTQSLDELKSAVPASLQSQGLIGIRCAPKDPIKHKVFRKFDIPWAEALTVIAALPGGPDDYTFRAWEAFHPDFSGTIISDGKGKTIVELVRGDHKLIDESGIENLSHAILDQNSPDIGFHYDVPEGSKERKVMIGAVRIFAPSLSREALRNLAVYAEFQFKDGEYNFIEATDGPFWTRL